MRYLAVLLILVAAAVYARDPDGKYVNAPLHQWFESLKSKTNIPCCAEADGVLVADADWDVKGGKYRVKLDNQWVDVPDEAVLTIPNIDGRTMVWRIYVDGQPHILCFLPGAGI